MFGKKIAIVLMGLMIAGYAQADGNHKNKENKDQHRLISQLPDKGKVMIKGTVKEVKSPTEFILSDREGNTINVETTSSLTIEKKDYVKVLGLMDSEFAGIGKKIRADRVKKTFPDKITKKHHNKEMDQSMDYGLIDQLPDQGEVTLFGRVVSVDKEDKEFIIEDNSGDTIDVHTKKQPQVSVGDKVMVQGEVRSEFAGFGEEIRAGTVKVIKSSNKS